MIFVDTPFVVEKEDFPNAPRVFHGRRSAHLMADTEDELRAYAKKLGLKVSWIQHPGTYRAHFDVTGKFLEAVERDDTVLKLTSREMIQRYTARARKEQNDRYLNSQAST